ncbi:MAG: MFS transporter, UMF1 family [Candidatus Peregrinibacteria bacterium Gr01-1014_25]|nr:MAG: MFS transporter, UMF1 family [Candidatus Peregrinibacteria bacterium Gr01-1014_25]
MQTRKNIVLWVLYDFANSIVSIVFFLYFAQWIVIDRGVSDFHFNLAFTASAVLLLLTVPTTGMLLDTHIRRIVGLRVTTACVITLYSLCALSALWGKEYAALILFALGLYMYLLSFTFYTPLLNDIAAAGKRGRVSGFGIAANYLGQIVGLLIALPFSKGTVSLFHATPRAETLLPAILLFALLSLPALLLLDEPKHAAATTPLAQTWKQTFRQTRSLLNSPSVAYFLAAYFLFNDAILTVSNNFPIFLENVWAVGDTTKTFILLGILPTCAAGGVLSGFLADRFGHKRTLVVILLGWLGLLPLLGLLTDFTLFVISTTIMGFWFGASWTVSRSVMSHIAPAGRHNLAFAYFGLAERASSFIGPIAWGLLVTNLISLGSGRYRITTIAMTGFIVLGLLALARVHDERTPSRAG